MLSQNKNRKFFLPMCILLLMLSFGFSLQAHAAWVKNGDGTYSYKDADGTLARSQWIKKKYYVDANGIRLTGKQKIDSKWYYFSPLNGKLQKKRWITDGEFRYYAGKDGALYKKGIYTIGKYKYLFGADAVMKTGKCTFKKKTYYLFPENGRMMKNSWLCLDDQFYYFDKNGVMVKSKWLSGYKCYLDAKGQRLSSCWKGSRYLGKNGISYSGLHKISGTYYYFDPKTRKKVANRLITIKGKRWYFDASGKGAENIVPAPGSGVSVQSEYYSHPVVDDETLLSYIIYCEAGNQPYAGKLAVGYIILNRVYSKTFPASTVREVVYQKGQFSPVWNSALDRVYKTPSIVNEECKTAAKAVLKKRARIAAGKTVKINVNGKKVSFPHLYFLSPGGYRSEGLSSAYLQIGNHVFFSSWR